MDVGSEMFKFLESRLLEKLNSLENHILEVKAQRMIKHVCCGGTRRNKRCITKRTPLVSLKKSTSLSEIRLSKSPNFFRNGMPSFQECDSITTAALEGCQDDTEVGDEANNRFCKRIPKQDTTKKQTVHSVGALMTAAEAAAKLKCASSLLQEPATSRPSLLLRTGSPRGPAKEPSSTLAARLLLAVFGIGPENVLLGRPASWAIRPSSLFASVMQLISGALLFYTLVTAPLLLSFWNVDNPCFAAPTNMFDLFVDTFFLLEIVYNFFVGVEVHGVYIDSPRIIAAHYTGSLGLFWFDLATSIPVSWMDWAVVQLCVAGSPTMFSTNLAFLRAIKPLRILKMSRLLKIYKLVRDLSEKYRVRPGHRKILNLFLTLSASIHIFTCMFWRVKVETNSEDQINAFLEEKSILQSQQEVYIAVLYFVCTVFTTVGFGDISASTSGERIFCIFMMCAAAMQFGIILSELQEIFAVSNARTRELDDYMESVMGFLVENGVTAEAQEKVTRWIRFQFNGMRCDQKSRDMIELLPASLRESLASTYYSQNGLFSKVALLGWISDDPDSGFLRRKLIAEMMVKMKSAFYPAHATVASRFEQADHIMVISSGYVGIFLPYDNHPLKVLMPRDTFGETSVLGDSRWGGNWGVQVDFQAITDCKVVSIACEDVKRIVQDTPNFVGVHRIFQYLAEVREEKPLLEYNEEPLKERRTTLHWIWMGRRVLSRQRLRAEAVSSRRPSVLSFAHRARQGSASSLRRFSQSGNLLTPRSPERAAASETSKNPPGVQASVCICDEPQHIGNAAD